MTLSVADVPMTAIYPWAFQGLQNGHGGRPMGLPDQMARPGCNPGQRPARPQGGRFTPTLGTGAALVSVLQR